MKIAINACYGGSFSFSERAVYAYAALKGLTLYPEKQYNGLVTMYYTVPEGKRTPPLPEPWMSNSLEARLAYNEAAQKEYLFERNFPRDDPDLVAVIEQLGGEASGQHAELKVVEIPDDVLWEIHTTDGYEHIAEKHRTWY